MYSLACALISEQIKDSHRQLAGIIIKNAISDNTEQQRWLKISSEQRGEIKKTVCF